MILRRPLQRAIFAVLWSATIAACNESSKSSSSGTQPPTGTAAGSASGAPSTPASASVGNAASAEAVPETLPADASSTLTLAWKVEQRAYPNVAVSVIVGDKTI